MNDNEKEDLDELIGTMSRPTELMKKIVLLISETQAMGLPDEEGGVNFLHDFVASDLSDIFDATSVSSGAIDAAMNEIFEEFNDRGYIDCITDFDEQTSFYMSHLLNDISVVPMRPDMDEEIENWSERPQLSISESSSNGSLAEKFKAANENEETFNELVSNLGYDSRMITDMPSMQALMYTCFYMGAFSAKSLKSEKELNNMWNAE